MSTVLDKKCKSFISSSECYSVPSIYLDMHIDFVGFEIKRSIHVWHFEPVKR